MWESVKEFPLVVYFKFSPSFPSYSIHIKNIFAAPRMLNGTELQNKCMTKHLKSHCDLGQTNLKQKNFY